MSETLKPCPFDVGDRTHQCRPIFDKQWATTSVMCSCGAEGPRMYGEDEAIAAWDTRPATVNEQMEAALREILPVCEGAIAAPIYRSPRQIKALGDARAALRAAEEARRALPDPPKEAANDHH